jgi:hypothetical protein
MKSMLSGLCNLAIVASAFLLVSTRTAAADEDPYVCQPAPNPNCSECNPPGGTPCYVSCDDEQGFRYCDWCIDPENPSGNGC